MKKFLIRGLALSLACLMLLVSLTACGNKLGKPLLTLKKDGVKVTLSVNTYELMLSRMKGVLYASDTTHNGLDVSSPLFWSYQDTFDGSTFETIDDFYCKTVLDNCRSYLAVLYLFEKHVGKLSANDEAELERLMNELLETDGDGSMTKLNAVLSAYGVNYDILKDAYALDFKMQAVKNALYGANAANVGHNYKTAYLNENYVHFRQILLSTQNIVYKTDDFGHDIYYYPADSDQKGHIYYDVYNGERGVKEDGTDILDKNGDVVYYVKGSNQKRIAYDTIHGEREAVWNGSEIKTENMSDAEKEEVRKNKDALLAQLQGATPEEFEEAELKHLKESDRDAEIDEYDDGFYLPINSLLSGASAKIAQELKNAQIGDVIAVETESGWHIVMKYAHTEQAYDKEQNESYFKDFNKNLMEKLLLDECQALYPYIVVDEKLLAAAPKMKDVAINGIYAYY